VASKYFPLDRIKQAIEHLQHHDSNWVLVPLVFAVNGVSRAHEVNLNAPQQAGTDAFLDKHFNGSLIGLTPFSSGTSALRPRFKEIYERTMKREGLGEDYALHQGTKLWANSYSSRGYREMIDRGQVVSGGRSRFQLSDGFKPAFEQKVAADFHFEELLVWLYAFSGFDQAITNWESLSRHFQHSSLGEGNFFQADYQTRFHTQNGLPWPTDFLPDPPSNEAFQQALLPSYLVITHRPPPSELDKIVYGPPGVGKPYFVRQEVGAARKFITTFHPEYSHSDFVGAFRPATENFGMANQTITYRFRPEVFLRAYIYAWKNPGELVYLVIEEINRGNPAAIFGHVFQLLDREEHGYSEYEVSCPEEIAQYLKTELRDTEYSDNIRSAYSLTRAVDLDDPYSILILPKNLVIRATMNTSDQSLFPMDSGFKRRWSWQYIPITYTATDKRLVFDNRAYSWEEFLRKVNALIYEVLETEDKCIGPYFLPNDAISRDDFRNKILFYLWNDVLRDELPTTRLRVFPRKLVDGAESDTPVNSHE